MDDEKAAFLGYYEGLLSDALESAAFPQDFFARYQILACLAQADDKRVYQARRLADGMACIVKATTQASGDSAAREAELLARFHHPGIPRLLESFTFGSWGFVVRQYMEGKTLDSVVAHGGPLPLPEVARIGREAAALIGYLHSFTPPFVHRDIKPQNVILAPDGRVCLIDFGISRAFGDGLGRDTMYLGSYGYASPEQFGFSPTNPRTDIFAVGTLLYYLATGKPRDYQGDMAAVPSRRLRRVVRRSTQLDAARRYPSARRLQGALAWLEGTSRAAAWVRRRAVPCAVAGMVAVTAAVAVLAAPGHRAPVLPPAEAAQPTAPAFAPALARAMRASLGLAEDAPLTPAQAEAVTALTVGEADERLTAQALQQLAALPNLTDLTLTRQGISSLAFLQGLALERLDLTGNNITSLEPLKAMQGLKSLTLAYNPLADIAPLSSLGTLEALDLSYTEVSDAEPLKHLRGLTALDLSGCKATNLSALAELPALQELRLAYTHIRDFRFLAPLEALRVLTLRGAGFGELSLIQSQALEVLDVSWNYTYLTDVEALAGFARLTALDLACTAVTDLSPLSGLPSLRVLGLHGVARELPELPALARLVVVGEEDRAAWEARARGAPYQLEFVPYPTVYQEARR